MFAPTPPWGQPSSTITARLVFFTDSRIVSRSSGRSVRGSITSASISCSSASGSPPLPAGRAARGRRPLPGGQRHPGDPDHGHIVPLPPDRSFAEAHGTAVLGHLAALAVEGLVLD